MSTDPFAPIRDALDAGDLVGARAALEVAHLAFMRGQGANPYMLEQRVSGVEEIAFQRRQLRSDATTRGNVPKVGAT